MSATTPATISLTAVWMAHGSCASFSTCRNNNTLLLTAYVMSLERALSLPFVGLLFPSHHDHRAKRAIIHV